MTKKIDLSELENQPFIYRMNRDGTLDSICTRCFLTVGTGSEVELQQMETLHSCRFPLRTR